MGALQPLPALGVVAGVSGEGSGTGLGDKECGEDWGWDSVFLSSWPLEVKLRGNVKRMDFVLFFKARFPGRRKEEGSSLCQPSGHFGQQLTLRCWVSPPRKSSELQGQQQSAGVGSTAGVKGSWLPPLPLSPIYPFSVDF